MIDKLEELKLRFAEVEKALSDPDVMKDQNTYRELMREHAGLRETVEVYGRYTGTVRQLQDAKELVEEETDKAIREMAQEELLELEAEQEKLTERLKILLIPKDPMDEKDIIMEIRAGTGGDEAALFAADLYRMYSKFAEDKGWKLEIMSSNDTGIGGFKEIIYSISGKDVYANLRYESGGHRVQRVPETESGGRIHTSAVTVAVLPEAEETDIDIKQEELKIDVYRSSGPGGQSVNTTDSAVRITHLPTGLVVTCQDEKSQHKNKAKALTVLRARLLDRLEQEQHDKMSQSRKSQVGSGDRSERIRTYNFPQGRLTDHRINLTLYKLEVIMNGKLDEVIEPLISYDQAQRLKALS